MNDTSRRVYDSILGLLSNVDNPTPMVQLSRVVPFEHTKVYAKLEWYNPFGAVKIGSLGTWCATPRNPGELAHPNN